MFACAVFLFSSLAVLFYAFIASLQSSSAAIHMIVPLLHSFNYVWDVITYGTVDGFVVMLLFLLLLC